MTLTEQNLGWAIQFARVYERRSGELSEGELVSAACAGMLEAEKRFDPSRGFRFITYATPWMKREIYMAYTERAMVWIPDRERQKRRDRGDKQKATVIMLEDEPALAKSLQAVPTSAPMADADTRAQVAEAIGCLPPNLRRIIIRRFGLDGQEPETLASIAGRCGLSRERIRQLEMEALRLMRRRFTKLKVVA